MVLQNSTMLPLGTTAPAFELPDTDGQMVSLENFDGAKAYVVMFICNHCPYVKHLADAFATFGRDYEGKGVAIIAINSNDVANYPDDSPPKMQEEKAKRGWTFPYLYDETQEVAHAYKAACTPDFYVFDSGMRLAYRGQFDDTRPNKGTPTGKDLRAAVDAVLTGQPVAAEQRPSAGCNIKWKPGNEPDYYG